MNKLFDIAGKVALVTGGSRGIGEMIAEGFVKNGAKTFITSRKADQCDETAKRLSKFGKCISIPADLTDSNEIKKVSRIKYMRRYKGFKKSIKYDYGKKIVKGGRKMGHINFIS